LDALSCDISKLNIALSKIKMAQVGLIVHTDLMEHFIDYSAWDLCKFHYVEWFGIKSCSYSDIQRNHISIFWTKVQELEEMIDVAPPINKANIISKIGEIKTSIDTLKSDFASDNVIKAKLNFVKAIVTDYLEVYANQLP
jgi:hypothetical protein